ncbi:hypothetical protein [Dactylosporangium sp. NPDC051541]|uniref:hypothetical protein n=1 Tax=Dactylosporangium sp. NPDC051541 TaxID=3363977 RepID=UPI00378BD0F9
MSNCLSVLIDHSGLIVAITGLFYTAVTTTAAAIALLASTPARRGEARNVLGLLLLNGLVLSVRILVVRRSSPAGQTPSGCTQRTTGPRAATTDAAISKSGSSTTWSRSARRSS